MSGSGFRATGVDDIRRAADRAGAAAADTAQADADAAATVGPRARSTSPRATGRTAASLSWGSTADGFAVDVGVDWSVPLHWGAAANNQRPRPWVAEAFRAAEPDILDVYEQHLDHAVEVFDQ